MCEQTPERIILDGVERDLRTDPLGDFFEAGRINPGFLPVSTGCWRGYVGTWEVDEGRLYLVGMETLTVDGPERVPLDRFFPDHEGRVWARWFSGTLRLPDGEVVEWPRAAETQYERERQLRVRQGFVVRDRIYPNRALQVFGPGLD